MRPDSFKMVATGDGSASCPSASVPSCHRAIRPTISRRISSAGGVSRRSTRSAVTIGSASCAAGIEPALPYREKRVDTDDEYEQQHDQPIHHAIVERIVGERDGVADAGAGDN